MPFELYRDLCQLFERRRHAFFHGGARRPRSFACTTGDRLWRANSGDHVLTLRINQEFTVERPLAGRWIARERHARARGVATIAKHHRLHIHRCAPILGNVVQPAIGFGPRAGPRMVRRDLTATL